MYEVTLVLSRTQFPLAFRIYVLIPVTCLFHLLDGIRQVLRGKNLKTDVVLTIMELENE